MQYFTLCVYIMACMFFVQRFTLRYIAAFNCKVRKCVKPASHLQYVLQEHDKNASYLNIQSVIHWATIELNGAPINLSNTSRHIYVTGPHNAQMEMRYHACVLRKKVFVQFLVPCWAFSSPFKVNGSPCQGKRQF